MSDIECAGFVNETSKLRGDIAKVGRFREILLKCLDELVAATWRRDWREVGRVSDRLAKRSRESGHSLVSALAKNVNKESQKPDNYHAVKRSLIKLIGKSDREGTGHSFGRVPAH